MEIKDKVIIVTGASSGIGLATARLLCKKGGVVVLVARSKKKLNELGKTLPNSLAIASDVSRESDIKKLVKKTLEKFGKIDILINNAGRGYDAPIEKTNISKFRDLLELDLLGPLITMQKMIPVMRKQGGGVIINISSGTALMYLPNMGAYSSAKRALVGISLTARVELEHDKISVSVVYPYITQTDFEKNTLKDDLEEDRREWDKNIPTRDTPEYVADKILEVIKSGKAEIFAHDWMKPNK